MVRNCLVEAECGGLSENADNREEFDNSAVFEIDDKNDNGSIGESTELSSEDESEQGSDGGEPNTEIENQKDSTYKHHITNDEEEEEQEMCYTFNYIGIDLHNNGGEGIHSGERSEVREALLMILQFIISAKLFKTQMKEFFTLLIYLLP